MTPRILITPGGEAFARYNDRDIGGTDGIEVTAEIVHVQIAAQMEDR